ncbi:MAG: cupredoxin domain-containing protein, partial [Nitrosopumilaceae archaeon]
MNKIIIASVLVLLLIPLGYNTAFAKIWQVEIPTGAADPNAPFFYDPWELTVEVSDTVEWQNGDTAAHTVTSGTPTEGFDGKFDSGLLGPGKTFSYKFTAQDRGVVKYYCTLHPFMTGTINVGAVEEGFKVWHNVGSDAGDGKTTFDVQYTLDKVLAGAKVDENQKSVTFTMAGVGKDGDKFVVKLPKDLIEGPLLVWVDNVQT